MQDQYTNSPITIKSIRESSDPRIVLLDYVKRDTVASFAKAVLMMVATSASTGCGHEFVVDDKFIRDIEASFKREHPDMSARTVIQRHVVEICRIPVDWGNNPPPTPKKRERFERRNPLSVTKSLAVFAADGYRCKWCGTQHNLTVDHIIPWSKGGGDDPENLQTLCRSCNSRKGDR
jgi:5-methylcytosine-specific restriction endonuclease McrA